MQVASKAVFGGWTLLARWAPGATELLLQDAQGVVRAVLQPLRLDISGDVANDGWYLADIDPELQTVRSDGHLIHENGVVRYSLTVHFPTDSGDAPLRLDWSVSFEAGPCNGAILQSVTIPGATTDRASLTMPGLTDSAAPQGGAAIKPDPSTGFAVRADRMSRPIMQFNTEQGVWIYFAAAEAPSTTEPGLVYSLGMAPGKDGPEMFFCYPQLEYGHDCSPPAGQRVHTEWPVGTTLEKTLYLWYRGADTAPDVEAPARFLAT